MRGARGTRPASPRSSSVSSSRLQRGGEVSGSRSAPATSSRSPTSSTRSIPTSCRLTFLLQSIDTAQTFDLDVVTAQSMENPVYYVQYAHARIASIGRQAAAARRRAPSARSRRTSRLLVHERELDLLRALAVLPEVVAEAAELRAPHRVTTWVRDFAARFHGFYRDCRVHHRRRRAHAGAAVARRGVPHRARGRARPSSVCARPTRWTGSTTTTSRETCRGLTAVATDAPFDRTLVPAAAARASTSRRSRRSSARRCSSTTRTSCGGRCRELRRAVRAPATSRTRARRSSAPRWRGSSPRRACTSTSRPAASCTSRSTPASRRSGSCSTATTSRRRARAGARRRRRPDRRRLVRRARPARAPRRASRRFDRVPARVLVRVTPGVEAHTHEFIETGTERLEVRVHGRRAAIALATPCARVVEASTRCASAGLHCHIGSQVFRLDSFAARRRRWSPASPPSRARDRRDRSSELNLGGGLGVRYLADDPVLDDRRVRGVGAQRVERARGRRGLTPLPDRRRAGSLDRRAAGDHALPGRARSRRSRASRTYVAVDGGMSDNLRPVTYGAGYEAFLPARVDEPRPLVVHGRGQALRAGRRDRRRRAPARRASRSVTCSRRR